MKRFLDKGLLHFHVPADPKDRDNVAKWPRLSISPGQGIDGVAAISHWLHVGINVDPAWDFSHGVHNDINGGIEAAGL
eukprot:5378038-Pyramimonas_sp.AAC.1